jgi:DNA-binding transcriptional regulator PaaX
MQLKPINLGSIMKNKTKIRLKNFTVDVLDFLLGIPEAITMSFDRKELPRILNGFPTEKVLTMARISHFIANSKKSGYITVKKQNGKESIAFTNKAKLAIVDRIAKRTPSDMKFRFVSFDIPESLHTNRDKFRRIIKKLGFYQIQQSLWVSSRNVGAYVELAANEYQVQQYVVYLVCEHTNINDELQKKLSE